MAYSNAKFNGEKTIGGKPIEEVMAELREKMKKFYEFWFNVPIIGKILEKLEGLCGHRDSVLQQTQKENEQMLNDSYWLAGTNYQRIDKMNERMSEMVGMINTMLESETISDKQLAVLTDKCKSLNDDIKKEQERFRDMVNVIDETMDKGDGKWALATLPSGEKVIVDLEHADSDGHGTTVFSIDPKTGEFTSFKNLKEMSERMGLSVMEQKPDKEGNVELVETAYVPKVSDLTIDEEMEKGTTISDIMDRATSEGGKNWLTELANSRMEADRERLAMLEQAMGEKESLEAAKERNRKEIDRLAKEGAKKLGAFITPYEFKTYAQISKMKGSHQKNNISVFPEKGKPQGILIGNRGTEKGLFVHLNEYGYADRVSILPDVRNINEAVIDRERHNGQYIWKTHGDTEHTAMNIQENYKDIEVLVASLPDTIKREITAFVKESEKHIDNLPTQNTSEVKEAAHKTVNEQIQEEIAAKQDNMETPADIYAADPSYTLISGKDGSGVGVLQLADGSTGIFRADDYMFDNGSLSTLEGIRDNMMYANGRDMVTPEKMQAWNEGFAKSVEIIEENGEITQEFEYGAPEDVTYTPYASTEIMAMMEEIGGYVAFGQKLDEEVDKTLKKEGLRELPMKEADKVEIEEY